MRYPTLLLKRRLPGQRATGWCIFSTEPLGFSFKCCMPQARRFKKAKQADKHGAMGGFTRLLSGCATGSQGGAGTHGRGGRGATGACNTRLVQLAVPWVWQSRGNGGGTRALPAPRFWPPVRMPGLRGLLTRSAFFVCRQAGAGWAGAGDSHGAGGPPATRAGEAGPCEPCCLVFLYFPLFFLVSFLV